MVIASAPPCHIAFTTAWMSCWWTISSSSGTPAGFTDSGASDKVTVTAGPATGVKCVGNTVVLHGVPYAPPYVITAIGDQVAIERALESSAYLQTYREYVAAYRLGYSQEREADVTLPGYQGSLELRYARLARSDR